MPNEAQRQGTPAANSVAGLYLQAKGIDPETLDADAYYKHFGNFIVAGMPPKIAMILSLETVTSNSLNSRVAAQEKRWASLLSNLETVYLSIDDTDTPTAIIDAIRAAVERSVES